MIKYIFYTDGALSDVFAKADELSPSCLIYFADANTTEEDLSKVYDSSRRYAVLTNVKKFVHISNINPFYRLADNAIMFYKKELEEFVAAPPITIAEDTVDEPRTEESPNGDLKVGLGTVNDILDTVEDNKKSPSTEIVNHPDYYNRYGVEVIEMARRIWGDEAMSVACDITAFIYRMRAGIKPGNPVEQDLAKEKFWLNYKKKINAPQCK